MNPIKKIIPKLKIYFDKIQLPGLEGITILHVFQFIKEVFIKGNFAIRSAAVSFHFFVAIFPTLIFLLSLIPYLPFDGVQDRLLLIASDVLPNIIYGAFENTVNELFTRKYNALLSIGFILSLYYASLGINTLLTAFSQSYQLKLKNNYIKQQLLALGIFIIITILFVVAIAVSIISDQIHLHMGNIGSSEFIKFLFGILHYLVELITVMLGIAILFHFGNPNTKKFKLLNTGTVFSTVVIFLATWGLSVYFSNFNFYNKVYGSIGSLLITLIWINIVSYVIILGFELYTKADEIKKKHLKDLKT